MEGKEIIDIELVRAFMKSRNIDVELMSKKTGIGINELNELLNGADQRNMNASVFASIARCLESPLDVIIHRDYR